MSSEKIFVLGLDGASPEVIDSLIAIGRLPAFRKLKKEGVAGKLRTTIPPITGSAWSSFMTGKNPGKHGIFDFIHRKEGTYQLVSDQCEVEGGTAFLVLGRRCREEGLYLQCSGHLSTRRGERRSW